MSGSERVVEAVTAEQRALEILADAFADAGKLDTARNVRKQNSPNGDLATVTSAMLAYGEERARQAVVRFLDACAAVAKGKLRVVRRQPHEDADCAWNEAVLTTVDAIRSRQENGHG